MAPELIVNNLDQRVEFSTKIDVYSFSILMWMLWAQQKPYPHRGHSFMLLDAIVNGSRPVLDDRFPPRMAALLQECWATDPAERPSFEEIHSRLDGVFDDC